MQKRLLNYIQNELLDGEVDEDFGADTDLLGSGILDSLGMVQLIGFVEKEFEVKVAPEDMTIENFMDVNSVCTYIESKKEDA